MQSHQIISLAPDEISLENNPDKKINLVLFFTNFSHLPQDVQNYLLTFLGIPSLKNARLISKDIKKLIDMIFNILKNEIDFAIKVYYLAVLDEVKSPARYRRILNQINAAKPSAKTYHTLEKRLKKISENIFMEEDTAENSNKNTLKKINRLGWIAAAGFSVTLLAGGATSYFLGTTDANNLPDNCNNISFCQDHADETLRLIFAAAFLLGTAAGLFAKTIDARISSSLYKKILPHLFTDLITSTSFKNKLIYNLYRAAEKRAALPIIASSVLTGILSHAKPFTFDVTQCASPYYKDRIILDPVCVAEKLADKVAETKNITVFDAFFAAYSSIVLLTLLYAFIVKLGNSMSHRYHQYRFFQPLHARNEAQQQSSLDIEAQLKP